MTANIITQEGYNKLKKELELLEGEKRREISDRIQKAKEQGDLSENAEYSEAKDAQAFNEGRISEIRQMLKSLTVVDTNEKDTGKIGMGSSIITEIDGVKKNFKIVSFNEADPLEGKISNESPLGKAFIGKKKGTVVIVETPRGRKEYKILEIK